MVAFEEDASETSGIPSHSSTSKVGGPVMPGTPDTLPSTAESAQDANADNSVVLMPPHREVPETITTDNTLESADSSQDVNDLRYDDTNGSRGSNFKKLLRLLLEVLDDHRIFYGWIIFLCLGWGGIVVGGLCFFENGVMGENTGDYIATFMLLFGYFRATIQEISRRMIVRWSPTVQTMPVPIQNDVCFMIVDGTTFFLTVPYGLYFISQIFMRGSPSAFYATHADFLHVMLAAYMVDRLLHLANHFRINRFIHHFSEVLWALYVIEWNPDSPNLGLVIFGLIIETFAKPMWWWMACVRIARRHARNNGSFTSPAQGIDALFIPKTPERMAFYANVAQINHYSCTLILPFCLLLFYAIRVEDVPRFWKILNFITVLMFAAIDITLSKALWEQCTVEYWKTEILKDKRKQKKPTATANNNNNTESGDAPDEEQGRAGLHRRMRDVDRSSVTNVSSLAVGITLL